MVIKKETKQFVFEIPAVLSIREQFEEDSCYYAFDGSGNVLAHAFLASRGWKASF